MLTEKEFYKWADELRFPQKTIEQIQRIRKSPPSRSVGNRFGNVPGRYPSTKMGVTIQAESRTIELPFVYQLEHDDNVLEYYDQPEPIKLSYENAKNKNLGFMYTPDFFVMTKTSAYWVECKPEKKLIEISQKDPARYTKDENGLWRCSPAEEYAIERGLSFKVFSDASLKGKGTLIRNLRFLEDYIRDTRTSIGDAGQRIKSMIEGNIGINLEKLLKSSGEDFTSDDIYYLIAKQEIYVDIYKYLLVEPETVKLFVSSYHYQSFVNIEESYTSRKSNNSVVMEIGRWFYVKNSDKLNIEIS